jgi:hypothetical protein
LTTKKLKKPDRVKPDSKVSDGASALILRSFSKGSLLSRLVREEIGRQVNREVHKLIRDIFGEQLSDKMNESIWQPIEEARRWYYGLSNEKRKAVHDKIRKKYFSSE